jgi:hypothetical protein
MSETIKQLIVALIAAHVIGDFILQSDEDGVWIRSLQCSVMKSCREALR